MIARLDRQLTGSIKPAKIIDKLSLALYTTGSVKLSTQAFTSVNIPAIQYNQFRTSKIGISALPWNGNMNNISQPLTSSSYYPWWSKIVGGDSGNPYFTIINNDVIALGTWYYSGGGPSIINYQNEINTAIAALGSSTQLITSSLVGFPSY
jgi:hypothetical protein